MTAELRIIAGRFALEAPLAKGASGSVYRAIDQHTGRRVAVKIGLFDDGQRARFEREVRALETVSHRRLPSLVAAGPTGARDGEHFVALALIEGISLRSALAGPMSARDVRALGLALCEALEALHAKGIVHRDIKPENVLVPSARAMEDACLVDMGLALSIDDPRAITAGGVVGTPGYLPPEQLSATPPAATPRWDVFSLGCVLYECATGAAPFGGSDRRDALARTACGPAPDPRTIVPTIQDDLASLLCAMIAPRAVDRPEDGAAARLLLEAIARGDDAAPHGPPEPERFIAVILGHPTALGAPSSTTPAMIAPEDEASETLDRTMIPRGARVRTLGDGTLLLWLSSPALDRAFALRVVQCALLLADSRPDQRWSAAVSEGSSRNGWPVGPALDRALSMAQECEVGHVALDDAMSLLIDGAFALRARGNSRLIEARSALHSSS